MQFRFIIHPVCFTTQSNRCSRATSPNADILFTDGIILTMDDSNPVAQAIAIQGNKIIAVGSNEAVMQHRGEDTIIVNLEGSTLLPGFIDSHTHRITQRFKWGFSAVEEAAQEALSQGWTGLSELAVDEGQFNELREAAEQGRLKIRVNAYLTANTFTGESLPEWYNAYKPGQQFGPYLRIAGLKVFIDGNSGRRLYWEQEALNEFLRQRQAEGWQISMKAIGINSHEPASNNLMLVHEFKGATEDSSILEFIPPTPLTNIQFIKIVTTQSPSWVAWREIEIK